MLVALVFLILATRWRYCDGSNDICQLCECLPPGDSPVQAFCVNNRFRNEVFSPTTSHTNSLELIYISGMKIVNIDQNFETEKPLVLLIQNCTTVHISDHSLKRLQSLVMRDIRIAKVGSIGHSDLWTLLLEDIEQLTLYNANFQANYSVKIENIRFLTIFPTQEEMTCTNPELNFSISNSVLNHVPEGGLTVCGSQVKLEKNMFKSIAEGGFQIIAETNIEIANNHFEYFVRKAFNLSSPETHIKSNHFQILPAGALSEVSTIQDTFFTNNTIQDIDLGGVLLDMGWGMTIDKNTIDCDCASKRTSILNPKQDMLYLTNSSLETLQNIFLNNYCNLNCTVTLKAFSDALVHGDVCLTNATRLEEEKLCDVSILPEYNSEDMSDQSLVSAASRVEFLVPFSIIVVTILMSSVCCYGYKEMKGFKFVFNPQTISAPKLPTE